jgi:hypothetical protein
MKSAVDLLAALLRSPFTVLRWSVLSMWMTTVVILVAYVFKDRPYWMFRVAPISSLAIGVVAVLLFVYPQLALVGGIFAMSIFLGLAIGLSFMINKRLITTPF